MFTSNFLGSKSVFTISGTFTSNSPLSLVLDNFLNGLNTLAPFIGSFVTEFTKIPFTGLSLSLFGGSGSFGGVILPEGGIFGRDNSGRGIPKKSTTARISIPSSSFSSPGKKFFIPKSLNEGSCLVPSLNPFR